MNKWKNKVAVITGAGSGIGAGLAHYCAAQGMYVIACDVSADGLAALAERTAGYNNAIQSHSVDVSSAEAVEQLAKQVFADHGQVNLLFNNAGVQVLSKIRYTNNF